MIVLSVGLGKGENMDINEIKDYIIKTYPNSNLAFNYAGNKENYNNEQLIKECEDFFYYEKLNWCGCGCPEDAKKVIRDFLSILNITSDAWRFERDKRNELCALRDEAFKNRFGVGAVYDNELLLCLAYALDAAGFTEHGGSIGGAWIDTEGKMFLWLLEQNEELSDE